MWIVWLLVSCLLGWFALVIIFVALMHAKKIIETGGDLHWSFELPLRCAFPVGLLLDVAWNFIVGTIAFRERPREFTFTSRCKRHISKGSSDWRGARAAWWCSQLEMIDAGHC